MLAMKLGNQQNDFDSSFEQSLSGSFRKFTSGLLQNDMGLLSPGHSSNGSFRRSNSVMSTHSGASASSKFASSSRRVSKGLKDYSRKLVDLELFTDCIRDWVSENSCEDSATGFGPPFMIDELRKLDVALEGVLFQQLVRMPCSPYVSGDPNEDEYLALEDFLHAVVSGLWHAFWHKRGELPLFVSCPRSLGSKFYSVEKAISRGGLRKLCGLALISKIGSDQQVQWDQIMEFALFKPDILSGNELKLSASVVCEALFYGFHILVSRCLSKVKATKSSSVFLLVLDSKYGGVVKLGGDLSKLELNSTNLYKSAVEWIKNHAEVSVSPVDRLWNKFGNANWGDLGTLQVLLATYNAIVQWNGPPRKSIASLVSNHSLRLQKRRMEFCLGGNENGLVPYLQQSSHQQGEIIEVDQTNSQVFKHSASCLKLNQGEVLLLEDQQQGQKTFQVQESLVAGIHYLYSAVCLDYPTQLLTLYIGAHPTKLEPCWEDMSLWYQVQRQTKVLNIFKHQGITSKYLPEMIASGRILHSGPCKKQTPGGRCDHPLCGTPILVTSPVGEPVSYVVSQDGPLSPKEAIRCCRDCLAALRSATMANVQHGDICPENIIRVDDKQGSRNSGFYVPISWGRAVLEDRDSPAINLQFSSSHALQHGKLCPSSDAESLVYLMLFVSGGTMQQQDSIESALQWRETSWAKRSIQQQLGEVSPLLKAFADYVDSLSGTPYPVDYGIWLKRFSRAVDGVGDRGKMIEEVAVTLRLKDVAESSGTSGGS
ncbi:hypothetical protein ACFX1Z_004518 [Malus domestica]